MHNFFVPYVLTIGLKYNSSFSCAEVAPQHSDACMMHNFLISAQRLLQDIKIQN